MGTRKKTSRIWSIETETLRKVVEEKENLGQVLRYFGYNHIGGNSRTLKQKLINDKINFSHFKLGYGSNKGRSFKPWYKHDLSELLVEKSKTHRGCLKRRLIKTKILENKCKECGLQPEWNGKNLVLVIDHINGVNDDNRIENLQLLCPNCNSQTSTFAGRNSKKSKEPKRKCEKCGMRIAKNSITGICVNCGSKKLPNFKARKVKDRPSKEILIQQIIELGYCGTGRKYNVSGTAVKKWVGNTQIQKPVKPIKHCRECSIILGPKNKIGLCIKCFNSLRYNTKNKPVKEILIKEVDEYGLGKTGIKYNVSSTTIRRWLGRRSS